MFVPPNIPARYPNGFEAGAPTDFYTAGEADLAVRIAGEIVTGGSRMVLYKEVSR
ncbi:MAG: hypothetical protein DDT21_00520 [Syntrophomonadaceae bacterium]|nr:hypothetical protein [Bacillota bacterium]